MSVLAREPVSADVGHPSPTGLTPARQAYWLLYIGFIAAPIIAGLDKFTDFLVQWEQYLTPPVAHALPLSEHAFMRAAGIIEIVAGLLVAFRPAIGGRATGFRPGPGGPRAGSIERAVRAILEYPTGRHSLAWQSPEGDQPPPSGCPFGFFSPP